MSRLTLESTSHDCILQHALSLVTCLEYNPNPHPDPNLNPHVKAYLPSAVHAESGHLSQSYH